MVNSIKLGKIVSFKSMYLYGYQFKPSIGIRIGLIWDFALIFTTSPSTSLEVGQVFKQLTGWYLCTAGKSRISEKNNNPNMLMQTS